MCQDDLSYYQHRAAVEIERARQAEVPEVAQVHRQFAKAYLSKLASPEPVCVES